MRNIFRLSAIALSLLVLIPSSLFAEKGMFFPSLAKQQIYKQMKREGLNIAPSQLYNEQGTSISNSVVALTSQGQDLQAFATASFISPEGLLLTNYHCVISHIERFSSEKNDFLKYGLWSEERQQEPLCFGLQAAVLIHQEEVTKLILAGTAGLEKRAKEAKINDNSKRLTDSMDKKFTGSQSLVSSYMAGNGYILNVYLIYKDVRMVAAPPMALGKFAGADDNWMWPRHTIDFAMLRVYADEHNRPAPYSKENVPYRPAHFLPISAQGVKEGDFTMVVGYPSSTRQYVPSFAVEKIIFQQNQAKVNIREEKLKILHEAISENPSLRYRYTTRIHSVENSYLRWKGEIEGARAAQLIEAKQQEEAAFQRWADANPTRQAKYGSVLNDMKKNYDALDEYHLADVYFQEAGLQGAEVVPFAGKFEKLMQMFERTNVNPRVVSDEVRKLLPLTDQFFHHWDYELDRKFFRNMFFTYYTNTPEKFHFDEMNRAIHAFGGDIDAYATDAFSRSIITHKDSLTHFLNRVSEEGVERMKQDPVYQMAIGYYRTYVAKINPTRTQLQAAQNPLYSLYLEGVMEMNKGKMLPPDANRTQRLSYGKVARVESFPAQTYLSGMILKSDAHGDSTDYYLPRKLRSLYQAKEFGRWAQQDDVPLNFLSTVHTTSANSGSPILNAKGELVGLNFDRYVKGVASDYQYMPAYSRSIAVDARMILFILEHYSRSPQLINELQLTF